MPGADLVVAFLAGYGLMSLALALAVWVRRRRGRRLTVSAVLLAGDDERRIEGILRDLNALWEGGGVVEIVVGVAGQDGTRAIVARLAGILSGLRLLPEGTGLGAALQGIRGQTAWLVDLGKIPETAVGSVLHVPGVVHRPRRAWGRGPRNTNPAPMLAPERPGVPGAGSAGHRTGGDEY